VSCSALLSTGACHREHLRPLTEEDLLPVLRATPIAPIRDTELFDRLGDEYQSTHKELELRDLVGKDEAGAIAAVRDWLPREFGPATDGLELVCVQFREFTSKTGGIISFRQRYRGFDTPGFALFGAEPARFFSIVSVNLYELSPTNDPPARVIAASEASDRANRVLSEESNAMSKRREGDKAVLQYEFVAGQSSRDAAGRHDRDARLDLFWGFRLPSESFSRLPFINARTGEASVGGVCGTGDADPVVPVGGK
jgi:hypothetical protein